MSIPKIIAEQLDLLSLKYNIVDAFECNDIYEEKDIKNKKSDKLVRTVGFKVGTENYLAVLPFSDLEQYRIAVQINDGLEQKTLKFQHKFYAD